MISTFKKDEKLLYSESNETQMQVNVLREACMGRLQREFAVD